MKIIEANQANAIKRTVFFLNTLSTFSPFSRLSLLAKDLRRDNRGVIVIMFALLLPVLLGVIGIGVEVGNWYQSKRGLQSAADAAAIAGAYAVKKGDSESTAYTKAVFEAERNWGNTFSTSEFDSNIMPPTSGSYTTDSSAVEVELSKTVSLMFIKYLMSSSAITINARAVATVLSGGEACVLTLDTTDTGVDVSGNGTITFDNCVTVSNSSDSNAALEATGSGQLATDCYHVVGGVSDTSQMTFDADCSPTQNGKSIDDPFTALVDPNAACDDADGYTHNVTSTVTYDGSFADPYVFCGELWVKKGTVKLRNGIFVIDGLNVNGNDLKTNSTGTLIVENATIILKNGAQINNFNGSSTVQMTAPTSSTVSNDFSTPGIWEGISIYQDRNTSNTCTGNNCNNLNGNSSSYFDGVLYFPNQEIYINGGNETVGRCMRIVALRLSFAGNSNINIDNDDCTGMDDITVPGGISLVE